ncbi:carbohydrate esterase family 16 protein [Hydnomerulius pinastri MD-312]|nr:carbohydrate esterase family 16 protein [Hydnomerulius pinastri MD-312]
MPSSVLQVGSSWLGFEKIIRLVIFGASYCQTADSFWFSKNKGALAPRPSLEEPLGVEFPGETSAETGKSNWVGHLITADSPDPPKLVHNYARSGDTVIGIQKQIQDRFLPEVGKKPDWAPWNGDDTLFITWAGINNVSIIHPNGGFDFTSIIADLLDAQDELYKAGARNFVFINVPPIHRCPGSRRKRDRLDSWNETLEQKAREWALHPSHSDAYVMIYSSWDTFTRVIDDPVSTGFDDPQSQIWVDQLHPTSKMHAIISKDLTKFLGALPPYPESTSDDLSWPKQTVAQNKAAALRIRAYTGRTELTM